MQNDVRSVIKALGDDTRYQIYTWLSEHESPATISEIADSFDLHPNTVRPHLDRLRDSGLVELDASSQGSVGRPQHRYRAVETDLEVHSGAESSSVFVRMLADLCIEAHATPEQACDVGRNAGHELAEMCPGSANVLEVQMDQLGFDPTEDDGGCIVFTNCPFRELAQAHPELICRLHEGLVRGIVEVGGGHIEEFHDVQRTTEPCMAIHS